MRRNSSLLKRSFLIASRDSSKGIVRGGKESEVPGSLSLSTSPAREDAGAWEFVLNISPYGSIKYFKTF
jgi:hypothetical protein